MNGTNSKPSQVVFSWRVHRWHLGSFTSNESTPFQYNF
jgi:hypothetical protein